MGVSTSGAQLARKLETCAAGITGATPAGVRAGANLIRLSVLAVSPSSLRNVGKRGSNLGVRVRSASLGPAHPVAYVKAVGPWPIHEFNTKPHTIPRLKGGRSHRTGLTKQYGPAFGGVNEKKLRLPDGRIRSMVFHPGTKGKHTFSKGVFAVADKVPKLISEVSVTSVLRTVF